MDAAAKLRTARYSPQVAFTEYLAVRRTVGDRPILVFEGKHCPHFYLGRVLNRLTGGRAGQLITRGKKTLLGLREVVSRNVATRLDEVLYFVDKDYDPSPSPSHVPDLYVTRGYSIENEVVRWDVLEQVIRTNFDIADADDNLAIGFIEAVYGRMLGMYLSTCRDAHRTVFVCRTNSISCMPGESIKDLVDVQVVAQQVRRKYETEQELFGLLRVDPSEQTRVSTLMQASASFDELDPVLHWRGKFHFSFVQIFLSQVCQLRREGAAPFARQAKIAFDAFSPSVWPGLFAAAPTPACLEAFLTEYTTRTKLRQAPPV